MNLNETLAAHPELDGLELAELVAAWRDPPSEIRIAVRNHCGGHLNHSFFWPLLAPSGGANPGPAGALRQAVLSPFSSLDVL